MATLGASMVTLLTDNWAGAGATPTFGALIDYQKDLADTEEQVIVRLPIYDDADPINDILSNFEYIIQLRVKTTVSEDRLKVLTDETIRIINSYALTGITRQFAKRGENTSDRKRQVFSHDIWARLEEHMSTGGTSYSSPGAGDVAFPADVTVAGTLGVTGDATVANLITAGNVDGVDVSEEPARITAEIATAVAAENELSEMNDVTISAPADNEFLAYHNATSKWINQTRAEAAIADGDIDHDALTNTHDLTTDIDHDAITNFAAGEHFTEGSIDHGSIAGLGDDDHTHYFLADGSRTLKASGFQDSLFNVDAPSGYDAGVLFSENENSKGIFFWDQSLACFRLYNYGSSEFIALYDGGGAAVSGNLAVGGDLTVTGNDINTPSSTAINAISGVIRLKLNGVEKVYVGATNTIFKNDITVDNDILTQSNKSADVGATGTAWDNMYADDYVNESPFIEIENPLEAVNAIKAKDGKLDYESMPDWIRATKRINQIKGVDWKGEPKIVRKGKKVVAEKGFSINRMCVLLYQALQEATARIEALEAA